MAWVQCARAEQPNSLTEAELADGWILLFDGRSLFGWQPAGDANWSTADGTISVSQGKQGLLATTSEWADYELKVDFRAAADTNSGVFLRTPPEPTDPAIDCYELNIAPASNPFPTCSLVKRVKTDVPPPEADQWHTFQVVAVGGRIVVRLDGREVLDYTDDKPLLRGLIGLQLNEGPVQFRNVKLRPLRLEPIFTGTDLVGWKAHGDTRAEVTREGWLHLTGGPGYLECDDKFGDFVLQLRAITGGLGLNSGIFFRSIPGQSMQGYECQIHNLYHDGDRARPVDCGTGGFYRRQNARRVMADDFEWFHLTLVATGRHMASWVNGYPVCDWTDERPADDNPRRGLRTAAGTLQLQGHDAASDVSFRLLRAAELPAE